MIRVIRRFASKPSSSSSTPTESHRPTKATQTRTECDRWIEETGRSQFEAPRARGWLHPLRPFPRNPWFVPPVPLSDQVKEEMYRHHLENPDENTPRKLAVQYAVSQIRVEAILRLKHLEKKQIKDGYIPQTELTKGMEQLLGCQSHSQFRITETHDDGLSNTPTILKAPLNNLSPLPSDETKKTEGQEHEFKLSGVHTKGASEMEVLEEKNEREVNRRWKFVIADTSSKKVLVRDRDGTLRVATDEERSGLESVYPYALNQEARHQRYQWAV